ncbi:MAG TPA: glycosyltransferase family 4 protein, partial [Geminicoccaceae bacterium]|nr:glycosyltransferase family 4 protein [Geminicoccaceae bacterium]
RIFVLPSAHEALGNVVLEAMASGLAVITTRTGASELIRDNGIVIEAADRRSLATAVERYLDDPALLAAHRRNSRRLAETMSWSAMADWYIRIYREAAVHAEPGCRRKDLNPPTTAYHARMP